MNNDPKQAAKATQESQGKEMGYSSVVKSISELTPAEHAFQTLSAERPQINSNWAVMPLTKHLNIRSTAFGGRFRLSLIAKHFHPCITNNSHI